MGVLASISGTAAGPILDQLGFHWLAALCGLLIIPVALLAATTRTAGRSQRAQQDALKNEVGPTA